MTQNLFEAVPTLYSVTKVENYEQSNKKCNGSSSCNIDKNNKQVTVRIINSLPWNIVKNCIIQLLVKDVEKYS